MWGPAVLPSLKIVCLDVKLVKGLVPRSDVGVRPLSVLVARGEDGVPACRWSAEGAHDYAANKRCRPSTVGPVGLVPVLPSHAARAGNSRSSHGHVWTAWKSFRSGSGSLTCKSPANHVFVCRQTRADATARETSHIHAFRSVQTRRSGRRPAAHFARRPSVRGHLGPFTRATGGPPIQRTSSAYSRGSSELLAGL